MAFSPFWGVDCWLPGPRHTVSLETFNKPWNLKLTLQRGMLAGCMHEVCLLYTGRTESHFCACLHMCCMTVTYHVKACLNYDMTCQRYVNCLQKRTVCISCDASWLIWTKPSKSQLASSGLQIHSLTTGESCVSIIKHNSEIVWSLQSHISYLSLPVSAKPSHYEAKED